MTPFRRGHIFWLRVPSSNGGRVQRSTSTTDAQLARRMAAMIEVLADRRDWTILDALATGKLEVARVWDAYSRNTLDALRADLDDLDLEPMVERWHEELASKGLRSADRYVTHVRELIPEGERFPRSRFTRRTVSEHLAQLEVTGSTKNRHRASLSVFARWLVEREVLETNVVRDVRAARPNPGRMRYLERDEIPRVVAQLPERYRALVSLLYASGMELSAALRTRRRDVDLTRGTVHAHGSKTAWRNRVVRVEAWALPALSAACATCEPSGLIFAGLSEYATLAAHTRALEALELEHATLHDARHTYAVNALRDGMSPQVVAHQLGHRDAYLTLTLYGRFIVRDSDYALRREDAVKERKRARRGGL